MRASSDNWPPLLIGVALALTLLGGLLPAFQTDQLLSSEKDWSVLGGALALLESDQPWIGLLLLGYSVALPMVKLLALAVMVLRPLQPRTLERLSSWLSFLGKWSMLDVFAVSGAIAAANLGILSEVNALPGIYVFAGGILLSMLVTLAIADHLGIHDERRVRKERTQQVVGVILSGATLVLLGVALALPLMSVEKWWFWDNQVSLMTLLPDMVDNGEWLLPTLVVLLGLAIPLLRSIVLLHVRMVDDPSPRLLRRVLRLDDWSMHEVLALALAVVALRVTDFADVTLHSGFWALQAATLVASLDSLLFRLVIKRGDGPVSESEQQSDEPEPRPPQPAPAQEAMASESGDGIA